MPQDNPDLTSISDPDLQRALAGLSNTGVDAAPLIQELINRGRDIAPGYYTLGDGIRVNATVDTIALTVLWGQLDHHREFVAAWPDAAEEWDPEGISALRVKSEEGFEQLTETGGWRFFTTSVSIDVPDEEV